MSIWWLRSQRLRREHVVSATRQAASQKRNTDGRSRAIYTHPRPEVTTGTGSPSPRGKDSEVQRDRGSLEMQGERETIERNCILPSTPPLRLQLFYGIVAVQSPSPGRLFATPWAAARQASLSSTVSHSLPKLTSHEWGMPSSHLILCCPPLLPPSIFPSIRLFSNAYSGLISSRMDWFDLLAVQGTLKSSPAPRFESTSSLAPSLLYGPNLTSIHDHWKNHSFD